MKRLPQDTIAKLRDAVMRRRRMGEARELYLRSLPPRARAKIRIREAIESLVTHLNMPFHPEMAIDELKTMLHNLAALQRKARAGARLEVQEIESINRYFARHEWITQLIVASRAATYFENIPARFRPESFAQRLSAKVVLLAQHEMLERLRQCHCGKWFYASKGSREHCSNKCRGAKWRGSEQGKRTRDLYQKKQRAERKTLRKLRERKSRRAA
jgi:hypothetical protein